MYCIHRYVIETVGLLEAAASLFQGIVALIIIEYEAYGSLHRCKCGGKEKFPVPPGNRIPILFSRPFLVTVVSNPNSNVQR